MCRRSDLPWHGYRSNSRHITEPSAALVAPITTMDVELRARTSDGSLVVTPAGSTASWMIQIQKGSTLCVEGDRTCTPTQLAVGTYLGIAGRVTGPRTLLAATISVRPIAVVGTLTSYTQGRLVLRTSQGEIIVAALEPQIVTPYLAQSGAILKPGTLVSLGFQDAAQHLVVESLLPRASEIIGYLQPASGGGVVLVDGQNIPHRIITTPNTIYEQRNTPVASDHLVLGAP